MGYWDYVMTLDRKLSLEREVRRSTRFADLDLPPVRVGIIRL